MICNFSTKFPDGSPSQFIDKVAQCIYCPGFVLDFDQMIKKETSYLPSDFHILDIADPFLPKLHTLRRGHRWKAGMKAHIYTGSRTKAACCHFVCYVKSVQEIWMMYSLPAHPYPLAYPAVYIDERLLSDEEVEVLAKNDGFRDANHFFEWFSEDFDGQIVHFTDLRY